MKSKCNKSANTRNRQRASHYFKPSLAVILILMAIHAIFPRAVSAYIDPGTASVIFSSLGYLLGMLGVFVGILIWPIRHLYYRLREKLGERRKRLALFISIGTLVALALVGVVVIYYFL